MQKREVMRRVVVFQHTIEVSTLPCIMPLLISVVPGMWNCCLLTYLMGKNGRQKLFPPRTASAVVHRRRIHRYKDYTIHTWSHVMYERTHKSTSSLRSYILSSEEDQNLAMFRLKFHCWIFPTELERILWMQNIGYLLEFDNELREDIFDLNRWSR